MLKIMQDSNISENFICLLMVKRSHKLKESIRKKIKSLFLDFERKKLIEYGQ